MSEVDHHQDEPLPGELILQEDGTQAQPIQPVVDASPATLLSQALAAGLDPDTLQKFMDLQDRHEGNEARKAYADAMAKCQAKMQPIVARAENDHTSSYYAKLGTITKEITPIYGRYGFSVSFGHGKPEREGEIRTTARVLHKLGHYEEYFVDLPPDDVGSQGAKNKTPIHARQSSNTYGKRSLLMGIFNLSILSEDDDGNAAGGVGNYISEDQAMELAKVIHDAGLKTDAILREFGLKDLRQCPLAKFEKLEARVKQIAKARQQA